MNELGRNWGWLYPFRVSVTPLYAVPALIAACFLLSRASDVPAGLRQGADLLPLFEVYLPLAAALLVAPVVSLEVEQRTWPLLLSYPMSRTDLILHKLVPPVTCLVLSLAAAVVASRQWYAEFDVTQALSLSAPTWLVLTGLSLLVGQLTGAMLPALTVSACHWAVDVIFRGEFTRGLYLFNASYPREGLDLTANKGWLLAAGLVLWLANLYTAQYRSRA